MPRKAESKKSQEVFLEDDDNEDQPYRNRIRGRRQKSVRLNPLSEKKQKKEESDTSDLSCLNGLKLDKKYNEVEERINSYTSELHTLLGEGYKSEDNDPVSEGLGSNLIDCDFENDVKKENQSELHETSNGSERSLSPNFEDRQRLMKTEELQKSDKCSSLNSYDRNNLELRNINFEHDLDKFMLSPSDQSIETRYLDMSQLPEPKINKLIFKALLLQYHGMFSSADESEEEMLRVECKRQPQKRKYQRQNQQQRKRPRWNRFSRFRRNRYASSPYGRYQVIDIEGPSWGSTETQELPSEVMDLDIESCDWTEPFDLNDSQNTNSSDLEVIASPVTEEPRINTIITIDEGDAREETNPENSTILNESSLSDLNKTMLDKSKKIWECPICFEPSRGQEVVATVCGHIFCKKCLRRHNKNIGKSCPTCRTDLKDKPPITLYNI